MISGCIPVFFHNSIEHSGNCASRSVSRAIRWNRCCRISAEGSRLRPRLVVIKNVAVIFADMIEIRFALANEVDQCAEDLALFALLLISTLMEPPIGTLIEPAKVRDFRSDDLVWLRVYESPLQGERSLRGVL